MLLCTLRMWSLQPDFTHSVKNANYLTIRQNCVIRFQFLYKNRLFIVLHIYSLHFKATSHFFSCRVAKSGKYLPSKRLLWNIFKEEKKETKPFFVPLINHFLNLKWLCNLLFCVHSVKEFNIQDHRKRLATFQKLITPKIFEETQYILAPNSRLYLFYLYPNIQILI